ncbi:Uncharacterized protein FWK35_00027645, partial [Aphis craccivora]
MISEHLALCFADAMKIYLEIKSGLDCLSQQNNIELCSSLGLHQIYLCIVDLCFKLSSFIMRFSKDLKVCRSRKSLYYGLVRPILKYGPVIYGHHFIGSSLGVPHELHDFSLVAEVLGQLGYITLLNVEFFNDLLLNKNDSFTLLSLSHHKLSTIPTNHLLDDGVGTVRGAHLH